MTRRGGFFWPIADGLQPTAAPATSGAASCYDPPMTSDLDIIRAAQVLISQRGEDAPIHAAMRADELLDKGDMDGCAVWKRILAAVQELLNQEPEGTVH